MGKGLREEPGGQSAELEGEQAQGVRVTKVCLHIAVERITRYPVHHDCRKFFVGGRLRTDEKLLVEIADGGEKGTRSIGQFLGDEAVAFGPSFLFTKETLHRYIFVGLGIVHPEHHGKVSATHDGIAIRV